MFIHCHSGGNTFHISSIIMHSSLDVITARKRSLRRLCFYTCLSVHRGGGWYPSMPCRSPGGCVSQHALQVSRGVYPSMPCRFRGPHPRGNLRGLARGVSRSTPREGLLQAHTWEVSRRTPGGSPGPHLGGSPGPHPGGSPGPHGGCIPACTEADPPSG